MTCRRLTSAPVRLDAAMASFAKFFRIRSDETFLCLVGRGKKSATMQRAQHVSARKELRRDASCFLFRSVMMCARLVVNVNNETNK